MAARSHGVDFQELREKQFPQGITQTLSGAEREDELFGLFRK
jgi:hypothetical protein